MVFGAGEYYDEQPVVPQGAFVVAADGGLDHARLLGVAVDVTVGDFDSIAGSMPQRDGHIVTLPAEKDDSDMLSALKIGWSQGGRIFHIYGGLGARIDHCIANIELMALLAEHGGIGLLHGDGHIVTAVCDGALQFEQNDVPAGRMLSVFAHSDNAYGVSELGLKYEVTNMTMSRTQVVGLSNEFRDGLPATIEVQRGTLIVTFPTEAPLPQLLSHHSFQGDLGELDTKASAFLHQ